MSGGGTGTNARCARLGVDACVGERLRLRESAAGACGFAVAFSSSILGTETGDVLPERAPKGAFAPLPVGLDGDLRLPSKLKPRLNSFSKLSRTRPPALRFVSLVLYGSCVFRVGRVVDMRGVRGPIGSSGSRLGFSIADLRDGFRLVSLNSSVECPMLSEASEPCVCCSERVARRTASKVGASAVDTIEAVLEGLEGRCCGGVVDGGG